MTTEKIKALSEANKEWQIQTKCFPTHQIKAKEMVWTKSWPKAYNIKECYSFFVNVIFENMCKVVVCHFHTCQARQMGKDYKQYSKHQNSCLTQAPSGRPQTFLLLSAK